MEQEFKMDLQLFNDGEGEESTNTSSQEATETTEPSQEQPKAKYTDEDVDKIINKKFAEWEKRQKVASQKEAEAIRLKNMTEEEKTKHIIEELQERISNYEKQKTKTELTNVARNLLKEDDISIEDALLDVLIREDAESTKANIESFKVMYRNAVEKGVANKLRGNTQKLNGTSSKEVTKEDILKIKNRAERQKLMSEHMDLFD